MTYSELFSKEKVNTGRQWAFDFADPLLLLVGMAILYVSAWLARREPFTRIRI